MHIKKIKKQPSAAAAVSDCYKPYQLQQGHKHRCYIGKRRGGEHLAGAGGFVNGKNAFSLKRLHGAAGSIKLHGQGDKLEKHCKAEKQYAYIAQHRDAAVEDEPYYKNGHCQRGT